MENRLTTTRLAGRHWATLVALGLILLITVAWWALALWPLPTAAPPALLRARSICFGTADNGLPTAVGWMMLIGEPMMITLLLLSVAGGTVIREALQGVARGPVGRFGLRATAAGLLLGVLAAAARVTWILGADVSVAGRSSGELPSTYPRIGRPAPALDLIDQRGAILTLAQLRGKPALVTFAYAHCETVCPLVVDAVVRARSRLAADSLVIVVITLDPWRDTPSRLSAMAQQWELPADAHVLSGTVAAVEAALDRWGIPHGRDLTNGEITHPQVVYVLDRSGQVAYAATGDAGVIEQLVRRL